MAREGDVVLIYHENNPTVFARVEDIRPDMKKDWYHITLLLLTIPTQTVHGSSRCLYRRRRIYHGRATHEAGEGPKEHVLTEVKKEHGGNHETQNP